jgi:hypothetical protein
MAYLGDYFLHGHDVPWLPTPGTGPISSHVYITIFAEDENHQIKLCYLECYTYETLIFLIVIFSNCCFPFFVFSSTRSLSIPT